MRVLGIDTSLRSTGVAVVEARGSRLVAVRYDTLRVPQKQPHSTCLRCIAEGIRDIIAETQPQAAAIEGAFFFRNARTAMVLGEARGTAIAACAMGGLPVFEYAPRRVKQAIVGHGGAGKEQLRLTAMQLLNMSEEPQEDASDALCIAICHHHSRSGHEALMPKPI